MNADKVFELADQTTSTDKDDVEKADDSITQASVSSRKRGRESSPPIPETEESVQKRARAVGIAESEKPDDSEKKSDLSSEKVENAPSTSDGKEQPKDISKAADVDQQAEEELKKEKLVKSSESVNESKFDSKESSESSSKPTPFSFYASSGSSSAFGNAPAKTASPFSFGSSIFGSKDSAVRIFLFDDS